MFYQRLKLGGTYFDPCFNRTGKICCFVVLWFYLPIILQAPPSQQTLLCWNCQVPVCSTIIVHTRHILWETWSNYLLFHIPYLISTFLSVIEIIIFNVILYSFFGITIFVFSQCNHCEIKWSYNSFEILI